MALTDNQARIVTGAGYSVGDVEIATDLTLQAIDKALDAIAAVAKLHHNPEMAQIVMAAASTAIARGATRSLQHQPLRLRHALIMRIITGEFEQ